MPRSHIPEILQFAITLADVAERQILPVYRKCTVSLKPDGTEVTEADRQAETAIREVIGKRYPDHLILGEEFGGPAEPTQDPIWVVDPIDGTISFTTGIPIFGTLIGYLEHGEPLAGVIHFPAIGETVFAAKGLGCWHKLRGGVPERVMVSNSRSLKEAFVSAGGVTPSDINPGTSRGCYRLSSVITRAGRFRFVHDCLQHALVAQGRLDAAIDLRMSPWDTAALVPCIEEAGGVVTDLEGYREKVVWRTSLLSSSSQQLHGEIIGALHDPYSRLCR